MENNVSLESSSNPNYPTFYQKNIDAKHPAIPENINTDLPDKSFTSATFLDVPYATQSDAQKMDIYLPASGNKPYPVIVTIHGGGWLVGDKRWIAKAAEPMLAKGYAVVSVNFRPSNEAIFPAQIYDLKAAIRWIRANQVKYSFNPEKIVAWGGSSGGHLAALLGTSAHVKELEDPSMGNPNQSSRVNAVVDQAGPIDFLQMDAQNEQLGLEPPFLHDSEQGPESGLLGAQISKVPEKCRAANPMSYIRDDNPPFYLQYGTDDQGVPYLQGVNLAYVLKAVIGEDKVWLEVSKGAGHGDSPQPVQEATDKIFDFLNKHLM